MMKLNRDSAKINPQNPTNTELPAAGRSSPPIGIHNNALDLSVPQFYGQHCIHSRERHQTIRRSVPLSVLIRLAQLSDTDWRHTNNASRTESEEWSKEVKEDDMIANRHPETERHKKRQDQCQYHGIEATIPI